MVNRLMANKINNLASPLPNVQERQVTITCYLLNCWSETRNDYMEESLVEQPLETATLIIAFSSTLDTSDGVGGLPFI